jgi:translation initiation factor 1A
MGKPNREKKRECPLKEEPDQVYARITAMLGNGRCRTLDTENVERLGIIRGNMRSREWIVTKDLVLLALRDFQDSKADIVYKYNEAEVQKLVRLGEVNPQFVQGIDLDEEDPEGVIFEEDQDIDIDDV